MTLELILNSLISSNVLLDASKKRIELLKSRLLNGEANVVILGQFKRGKSTLINALLGEPVLPTGVLPLTSIVTVLRGGSKTVEVKFQSHETRKVAWTEIDAYVTEKKNPNNVKAVSQVEIHLPSPLLEDGLRIIDTPGVGSIHEHNTRETLNYLPEADLAIFVLSVDQPLSQTELDFLLQTKPFVSKLIFALNKVDYVDPSEKDEIFSFIKSKLSEVLKQEQIQIFPVSAKEALEARKSNNPDLWTQSGLSPLEQCFLRISKSEKVKTLTHSLSLKAISVINQELSWIDAQEAAMHMSTTELEERLRKVQDQIEKVDRTLLELPPILKSESERLIERITHYTGEYSDNTLARITALSNEELAQSSGSVARIWPKLESLLSQESRHSSIKFSADLAQTCKHLHQEMSTSQQRRIMTLFSEVSQTVSSAFGVPVLFSEESETVENIDIGGFSEFRILPMTSSIIRGVLSPFPIRWVRGFVRRQLQEFSRDIIRSNFESYRWEYVKALDLIYRRRTTTILNSVKSLRDTLQSFVEQLRKDKWTTTQSTSSVSENLEARSNALKEAKESLIRLRDEASRTTDA